MGRTLKVAGKYRLVDTRMDFQAKGDYQILEKTGGVPEWKCFGQYVKKESALEVFDGLMKEGKNESAE